MMYICLIYLQTLVMDYTIVWKAQLFHQLGNADKDSYITPISLPKAPFWALRDSMHNVYIGQ